MNRPRTRLLRALPFFGRMLPVRSTPQPTPLPTLPNGKPVKSRLQAKHSRPKAKRLARKRAHESRRRNRV